MDLRERSCFVVAECHLAGCGEREKGCEGRELWYVLRVSFGWWCCGLRVDLGLFHFIWVEISAEVISQDVFFTWDVDKKDGKVLDGNPPVVLGA